MRLACLRVGVLARFRDRRLSVRREVIGSPEDDPAASIERSPLTYAPDCTAPLLFVLGDDDLRCPATEAEQYYRILRRRGVPTEMLRLPDSDHIGSWAGPVPARAAQNEALVEWFTRHLLGG
jgi:dipeptidyl aminopeptidase/acylaminoacyl peptidase